MTTLYRPPCHRQTRSYGMVDGLRRGSTSSISSDDDSITPCPLAKEETRRMQTEHFESSPRQEARPQAERQRSWRDERCHFNPLDSDANNTDPAILWRTMLAIQRTFGCYNSARMRAAIEMGEEDLPVPPKTCLDLLNDSITQLPEEARRELDDFLSSESCSRRRSSSSWKRRFVHGPSYLSNQ